MADETTPGTMKRRRVARPADDGNAPESTDDYEDRITEDRTQIGWPGVSPTPFVPHSYYLEFPEKFRPRFETSGQGENLTREQQKQMEAGWKDPIGHITIMNVSDKDNTIGILGMTPGETSFVKVPAYGGVIRGPLEGYLSTGIAGSKFSTFIRIGPSHKALSELSTNSVEAERIAENARRKEALVKLCIGNRTAKLVNGEDLCACMLYACPVQGHSKLTPTGELETLMSLRHAQYLVEAIGQTLTTRDATTGEESVLYTPELDICRKQIDAFIPLDNRPDSFMFATNRKHNLEMRENRIKESNARGKFVTGR